MSAKQSDAVVAGLMPDYTMAGVPLVRHTVYTFTEDVATGVTVELVPIPKGARILEIIVNVSGGGEGCKNCDVGDGSDTDRFMDGVSLSPGEIKKLTVDGTHKGLLYKYSAQDTIDIKLGGTGATIDSGVIIKASVWYKMTGSISDET